MQYPGLDVEHESAITAIIEVNATGQVQRRTTPSDPYIYHHKWLFVADDYEGFEIMESKARSERWISLSDVDRSRIGRRSFWEQNVLPRLAEIGETLSDRKNTTTGQDKAMKCERWVRSDEARKLLKLSTCDLAHARESGQIEFKKVGKFFLYLIKENSTGS